MASTAAAAKQWLITQLKAVPELNAVQITYSPPTEGEDRELEMIYFEGPVIRRPSWQTLGAGGSALAPLDEDYTIRLSIELVQAGDDAPSAEQRGWDLIAIVETVIRSDLRLGGLLRPGRDTPCLEFGEQNVEAIPHSDGWACRAVLPLECHART